MNANHARPMLAFWLLAAVAASITGLGLHAGRSVVTVSAGSPSPVTRDGSPDLLLGGVLHAAPNASTIASFTGSLGVSALPDAIRADAAPPTAPAGTPVTTPRTRVQAASPSPVPTAPVRATRPAPAVSTATAHVAPSRPARGHHTASGRGPTTAGAAAASTRAGPSPAAAHQRRAAHGHPVPGKRAGH